MSLYLLIVHGDVEPQIVGPFPREAERDAYAKNHRAGDPDMRDGIFTLEAEGEVHVDTYSGGFFIDDTYVCDMCGAEWDAPEPGESGRCFECQANSSHRVLESSLSKEQPCEE